MATSCAKNSIVEVFESSLDDVYSSSSDSPSTCTTKTSHSSSASLIQTNGDSLKGGDAASSCGDESSAKNQMDFDEEAGKQSRRCTRSFSLRANVTRSSKCSTQTDDVISNVTNSSFGTSSESTDSQSFDRSLCDVSQYATQNNSCDKPKDLIVCQWWECSKEVNFGELLEHLNNEHIRTQLKKKSGKEKPTYVCKWVGCKVYGKPSTLHSWLERHVVCHLGNKPFRCIVDHCGMRFSSQFMLNRHVNGHFPKQKAARPKNMAGMKVQKVMEARRKVKHPRPAPAVSRDFCDSFTMSCIQRYITNFCQRTQVTSDNSGQFITFHGVIVGRRTDFNGTKSCLVRWLPLHILPDEWLPEHQVPSKLTQVLPLSRISGDVIKFLMCDW